MNFPDPDELIATSRQLVRLIGPIMHGHGPVIQGAVLARLTAMWLAGHPPVMRDELLAVQVQAVRMLIPLTDAELYGSHGHPNTRPDPDSETKP